MANFQRLSGQTRTIPATKIVAKATTVQLPRIVKTGDRVLYYCESCGSYFIEECVSLACDETGAVYPVAHESYACWCENCWMALLASV